MRHFAQLLTKIEQAAQSEPKVEALERYLTEADDSDRLWTLSLLLQRRPRRSATTKQLQEWALAAANMPQWLFDESQQAVGDTTETIALILPPPSKPSTHPLSYWMDYITQLQELEEADKKTKIEAAWTHLDARQRLYFNKLLTGGFRIDLPQKLLIQALARFTQIEENSLTHRLLSNWKPEETTFKELLFSENPLDDISRPYPFHRTEELEIPATNLGSAKDWQAEYQWVGVRGQLIARQRQLFIWSGKEELVTDKFPELQDLAQLLPDGTVMDGELLVYQEACPLPLPLLQSRLSRKTVTKKVMKSSPVILMAFDLLEYEGQDWRGRPMSERREQLEALMEQYDTEGRIVLSPMLAFETWEELEERRGQAREQFCMGVLLKPLNGIYGGEDWWRWKVDMLRIEAVMIYAHRGQGSRAGGYGEYSFAVWEGEGLVPFTKASVGLSEEEMEEINQYVKANTVERFGPVRSIIPKLVFEIVFESINESSRHKSGLVLGGARIHRWQRDKLKEEANTLAELKALLIKRPT